MKTGSLDLDTFLNGGYDSSRAIIIYGESATGKTTLAKLAAIEGAKEGKVIYLDIEDSFNVNRFIQLAGKEAPTLLENIMVLKVKNFEDQLDKILEKMEDSDVFIDVNKYSEIFDRISKNYNLNHKYKTKTGREFFIRNIDPATNKIIVQVNKKDGGMEDRSYTEEEFNNFLVSPELFEGFIRIN